jgi:hypothetical protein
MDAELLKSLIEDIISSELCLRRVPYSIQDGAMEVDPVSIREASSKIIEELLGLGII